MMWVLTYHNHSIIAANYCGDKGEFDTRFSCKCNVGFAGQQCDVCAIGYKKSGNACIGKTYVLYCSVLYVLLLFNY